MALRLLSTVCALLVAACGDGSTPVTGPLERGRRLTAALYAGTADTFAAGTVIEMASAEGAILTRWLTGSPTDSLPTGWGGDAGRTVAGREGAAAFAQGLRATYGEEVEVLDEGVYPDYDVPGSVNYLRIARFSGVADNTITLGWWWRSDGSLVGAWVEPSGRVAASDFENYETKTPLRLPFDGTWVVMHGGRKLHENYHAALVPLRFAYDFAVDSAASLFRTDGRTNADHYCYGRPILAPAAGRVVATVDSFAENVPGQTPPGYRGPGNRVTIDHGNGEFSTLAHLRRSSVRVAVGQDIAAGQQVGECGNNGLSTQPHLHYQLQLDPRPGQRVVPAFLQSYWAGTTFVARGEPTRGQHIRHGIKP